ncbi:unnamed protein product [Rotaria sordida]|uniref:F-box domain-containing protein n=1 Tax=Rotaria sordida TaxID=392033 RepID=A0A816D1R7_9BILA|nr:unnamed protein product [Rotaria sordida]CAF1632422.1 unnamed protein product [Rotaria sordida]
MNVLNLPDEILIAIFNKLDSVDILYSLVNVNQRFYRLALDAFVIGHLDFVIKRNDIQNSSIDTQILDRICSKILPRINEKVNKLTVDQYSMECIPSTIDYPQLHSLSLVNYQSNILLQHLKGNTIFRLRNQITNLTIKIDSEDTEIPNHNQVNIFILVLLLSRNLKNLTFFRQCSTQYLTIWYSNISYKGSLSSTLTKLTINVNTFNDCLYLLNGSLQSLSTLIIRIKKINRSSSIIDNTKKLVNLKCFSLVTDLYTWFYDEEVVPLLSRMLNLEELTLFILVIRTNTIYIDGNQLYDKVLNYMPRLNKFIFSIHTRIMNDYYKTITSLPSKSDIRNSFIKRGIQSIGICADDKLINDRANCYVYSLPYQFQEFLFMSNCFQGGNFDNVRLLSMYDVRPFEHELFKIIAQDFPFLQQLSIYNDNSQKNKQHHLSTLITFSYLYKLNLFCAHHNYAIQFLSENNTRLPCLTNLIIMYETLRTITHDFTNDVTRRNCTKIISLITHEPLVGSQNFYSYFPSL